MNKKGMRRKKKEKKKQKEFEEFLHKMTKNKASREGVAFMNRMLDQIPELKDVYKEHQDMGDTILPHVLMGDVTRFMIDQHKGEVDSQKQSSVLNRCFDFLEKGLETGTQPVQELVSVSFLENLAQSDDLYDSIRSRLGSALRAELKFYEDELGNPPQSPQMPDIENAVVLNIFRDLHPGSR